MCVGGMTVLLALVISVEDCNEGKKQMWDAR
jgi:hypothetical protein